MFQVLEGDGVIDNLYHFLWAKDTIFYTDPSIYIPHTILYKYRKPSYWYFTSVVDHKLKKKNPGKLNNQHIKEVFLKHVSKSGIVCYFIYKKRTITSKYESDKPTLIKTLKNLFNEEQNKLKLKIKQNTNYENKKFSSIVNTKKENNIKYVIEYFDKKRFIEFLNNKLSYDDGVLQKFEDPKGDYNITYRLTWSPKLSLYEKCSNLKKITDLHYDIYERAVTYDGEEFQTKTEPVKGNHLPERMQQIAVNISNHVSNITLEKVKIVRMILNFKMDKKDRLLFLWCSSLRIEESSKRSFSQKNKIFNTISKNNRESSETKIKVVDEKKIKLFQPDNINIFKYSVLGKPIYPYKESYCLNCGSNVENYKLYEISFKTLIEGHDNMKKDIQFYPIYDKINMTSSGIEVMRFDDKKKNSFIQVNNREAIEKLKTKHYNNFIIPRVISQIYPKLSFMDYFKLKNNSLFLKKTAFICDSCYLEITKYCSMAGSNNENLLNKNDENEFRKHIRPITAIKKKSKINLENSFEKVIKYDVNLKKRVISPISIKTNVRNKMKTENINNLFNNYKMCSNNKNYNKNDYNLLNEHKKNFSENINYVNNSDLYKSNYKNQKNLELNNFSSGKNKLKTKLRINITDNFFKRENKNVNIETFNQKLLSAKVNNKVHFIKGTKVRNFLDKKDFSYFD